MRNCETKGEQQSAKNTDLERKSIEKLNDEDKSADRIDFEQQNFENIDLELPIQFLFKLRKCEQAYFELNTAQNYEKAMRIACASCSR